MLVKWRSRKRKIEKEYGEWLSHDIGFDGKKYSIKELKNLISLQGTSTGYFEKIAQSAEDFLKKPLSKSNVLDLACLEGLASFAFAGAGAKRVVGIDGRKANMVKANFTKSLLGLTNVSFKQVDVRNLILKEKSYDVVLAMGILYHLNSPDVFTFVENLYKWTKEITIIDTHVALIPKIKLTYRGEEYFGMRYTESVPHETNDSSIGNKHSIWLTKGSLYNLLDRVGYKRIYECKFPREDKMRMFDDRYTIIAIKKPGRKNPLFREKLITDKEKYKKDPRLLFFSTFTAATINEEG